MIDVKPTLAGLAEALNTLLANGVDPDSVVEIPVEVTDENVLEIPIDDALNPAPLRFDGCVDVETIGGDSRSTPGRKLRVILSCDWPENLPS